MDNQNIKILPERIKKYLNDRGLTDFVLTMREIGWNGKIVIPIFDVFGKVIFNKYRKDPELHDGTPKYTYDKGGKSALYGRDLMLKADEVVICEGEFDALALVSKGICAVTSTGGAGTFLDEWKIFFENKKVYVCFDNDQAGRSGLIRVIQLIPHAKCLPLPAEVKDITDYFVKLGKSVDDFRWLMEHAAFEIDVPPPPKPKAYPKKPHTPTGNNPLELAKSAPIGRYLKLNADGYAPCPFHHEKTASLKVDKANRFYCYGCSKWGDVVDIVMQIFNLQTTREAIDFILNK